MEKINELDELYMKRAIELAKKAAEIDEVPIGALIVRRGEIIYEAYNRRETDKLATAHAELLAIEGACRALGGWRLPESTLYVTLEPCAMCAGAIINARVERVVFGASDIRFGAFGSLVDLSALPFNHKPLIVGGVLGEECRELLSSFFKKKRKAKEGALATDIDN
jgi:tRNA(adenine34) deaminase